MNENRTEVLAGELLSGGAPSGAPSEPRKRGRPKGSKNKPKDGSYVPPTDSQNGDRPFNYVADPSGIAAAGKAFSTIWWLLAPMLKVRPLNELEESKAGEALDPILQKYLPVYNDWKYEINLAMVAVGLFQVCRADYKKEHPEEFVPPSVSVAEVIE